MPGSLLPGTLGAPPPVATQQSPNAADPQDGGPEADYRLVFPGLVLTMTFHPSVRLETGVATAYGMFATSFSRGLAETCKSSPSLASTPGLR